MAIVLDLIAVAIFALSIFLAYRKGLIRTLFSLLGGIVAVSLAFSLLAPVSGWVEEKLIGPAVHKTVLTAVNGARPEGEYEEALAAVDVASALREMPDGLRDFLDSIHADVDGIIAAAEQNRANTLAAKEQLIDQIASPISGAISRALSMVAMVIIFYLLMLVASRLLDAIFRLLPMGKTINRVGGVIFGIVRGGLLLMLFGAILYWLAQGNVLILPSQLSKTFLIELINQYNPILNVF